MNNYPSHVNFAPITHIAPIPTISTITVIVVANRLQNVFNACHDHLHDRSAL